MKDQEKPALEPTTLHRDYCGDCSWRCTARSEAAIAEALHDHYRYHFDERKNETA